MELVKARKRLTEPEVRFYMLQILSAIKVREWANCKPTSN
jgi:hypothetical protein